MPTYFELNEIYLKKVAIGGFSTSFKYWSSTEGSTGGSAWTQNFITGYQNTSAKGTGNYVRSVRAF